MANKNIFGTPTRTAVPVATVKNNAGGKAYAMSDKHALAQLAATCTFNGTFYADTTAIYEMVKQTVDRLIDSGVEPEFIAKVALYSRDKAYMKDMPAYLTARLIKLDAVLFRKVFRKVINNGKVLRTFMQIAASLGINFGRGTQRHAINEWFASRNGDSLFKAGIGNDPSIQQILRMAHPKPTTDEKKALFNYWNGKEFSLEALPSSVKEYLMFKRALESGEGSNAAVPNVDFRYVSSLPLTDKQWKELAIGMNWTATRMNINTLQRHNVFSDPEIVDYVATKLSDPNEIRAAKVFPYQLLQAFIMTDDAPDKIRLALQKAMEEAIALVPKLAGKVHVAVDTSGSMSQSITGYRSTATSKTTCMQVAALFAAAVLRKNEDAKLWPFDTRLHQHNLNPMDAVMTNATRLAGYGGGGTMCSVVLNHLNAHNIPGDAVIYVSDNESWADNQYGRGPQLMSEWKTFKSRNPKAKLVCIDIVPNRTSQSAQQPDILNIGGWSDQCFTTIAEFLAGGSEAANDKWLADIEAIEVN